MTKIANLDLITSLQSKIHDSLKGFIKPEEPLAILDFPDIKNCGDSAIWLGEMAYLHNRHGKRPDYVARKRDYSKYDLEKKCPTGPIFLQGGGTFGDVWDRAQDFREAVLEDFPKRQVIQFPQSIHYQSTERLEKSRRAIGRHGNFVLAVRDEQSRSFAEKNFDCKIVLCPDMAFGIGPISVQEGFLPILAMLRQDRERLDMGVIDSAQFASLPIEDWISERKLNVRWAKLIGALSSISRADAYDFRFNMLNAAARQRFQRGINQISRGKVVVTDRLHVHICSLLIGRHHAVLDNNYGKVKGFMNTFSGASNLSYKADSFDDAMAWAQSIVSSQ